MRRAGLIRGHRTEIADQDTGVTAPLLVSVTCVLVYLLSLLIVALGVLDTFDDAINGILGVGEGLLGLAHGLLDQTLGLGLLVPGHLAEGLLGRALELIELVVRCVVVICHDMHLLLSVVDWVVGWLTSLDTCGAGGVGAVLLTCCDQRRAPSLTGPGVTCPC